MALGVLRVSFSAFKGVDEDWIWGCVNDNPMTNVGLCIPVDGGMACFTANTFYKDCRATIGVGPIKEID